MNAIQDKDYMSWWNAYGEMADPEIEYRAWKAGRAFQNMEDRKSGLTLRAVDAARGPQVEGSSDAPPRN